MEVGLGVLGWAPHAFWAATPRELWAAYDGWRRVRGFAAPVTVLANEFEEMKRRFPNRKRRHKP